MLKHGVVPGALLALHGGAGPMDPAGQRATVARDRLSQIAVEAGRKLVEGALPSEVVAFCLQEMEDDPSFNAGFGSALQADGVPRSSAAFMAGAEQKFSGVINATHIRHPSRLAVALQGRDARVLSPPGTELLARTLRLPPAFNVTASRARNWASAAESLGAEHFADPDQPAPDGDTVGVLFRDANGGLFVGASTGGRGNEFPGRASDTCSVAGTYATSHAAIAATGRGEEIIDDALAARLETRVRDGATLVDACRRCYDEALERKRAYGWIAISQTHWAAARTTRSMAFVVHGGAALDSRIAHS